MAENDCTVHLSQAVAYSKYLYIVGAPRVLLARMCGPSSPASDVIYSNGDDGGMYKLANRNAYTAMMSPGRLIYLKLEVMIVARWKSR